MSCFKLKSEKESQLMYMFLNKGSKIGSSIQNWLLQQNFNVFLSDLSRAQFICPLEQPSSHGVITASSVILAFVVFIVLVILFRCCSKYKSFGNIFRCCWVWNQMLLGLKQYQKAFHEVFPAVKFHFYAYLYWYWACEGCRWALTSTHAQSPPMSGTFCKPLMESICHPQPLHIPVISERKAFLMSGKICYFCVDL